MQSTPIRWLAIIAALHTLVVAAPGAFAQVDELEIFIEINDTDGDAGIQLFIDGEGWDRLKLYDPSGEQILLVHGKGSVGLQGLTEAFFESAEPSFDEQPLADFLALFPEGEYRLAARSTEGGWSHLTAELTHLLPDAPMLILPIEGAEDVDPDNTVIQWAPVPDPPGSSIVSYEVIVEVDDDDAPLRVLSATLDPDVTQLTVPPEFMEPGTAYKFEVLAREESGNRTISEREFETAEE